MSIANLISDNIPVIDFEILNSHFVNTQFVDANVEFGQTLFVGAQAQTTNCQVGGGTTSVTFPTTIICKNYARGGSVGNGTVDIHTGVESTTINVGHTGAPLNLAASNMSLQASNLLLPSSDIGYTISNSFIEVSGSFNYNGATTQSNAARVVTRRIGNWTDVYVNQRQSFQNAENSFQPIIVSNALGVGYRPLVDLYFPCMVWINNKYVPGLGICYSNGDIDFGAMDTGAFTSGQQCGIGAFHVSFPVVAQ
jgi:hypothetical protein